MLSVFTAVALHPHPLSTSVAILRPYGWLVGVTSLDWSPVCRYLHLVRRGQPYAGKHRVLWTSYLFIYCSGVQHLGLARWGCWVPSETSERSSSFMGMSAASEAHGSLGCGGQEQWSKISSLHINSPNVTFECCLVYKFVLSYHIQFSYLVSFHIHCNKHSLASA